MLTLRVTYFISKIAAAAGAAVMVAAAVVAAMEVGRESQR
jgi:hypothetical protein